MVVNPSRSDDSSQTCASEHNNVQFNYHKIAASFKTCAPNLEQKKENLAVVAAVLSVCRFIALTYFYDIII